MSSLVDSERMSSDASVKNQSDEEEGSFEANLDSLPMLTTSYPVAENKASTFQIEWEFSPSPPSPPQNQSLESEQENDDIKKAPNLVRCMAVPFQYTKSERQGTTTRTFHSSQSHFTTEASIDGNVENNNHEESQSIEDIRNRRLTEFRRIRSTARVRLAQNQSQVFQSLRQQSRVFQSPSYEQNEDEHIEQQIARPIHVAITNAVPQAGVFQSPSYEQNEDEHIEQQMARPIHVAITNAVPQAGVFQSPSYEQNEDEHIEQQMARPIHIATINAVHQSQVFQSPSYEQNENVIFGHRTSMPFRVDEADIPRMPTRPSVSSRATSEASRVNAPPQTSLRVRRLSLPNATATTNHHHVHEHHHHVWNHYAPGASGPPGWPPHLWTPYQPWPYWQQSWRNTRCPTCGGGSRSPMWLLAQFPWTEKGGKLSLLGGLLFLLAMVLGRGVRLLRLARAPAPPAIE